MFITDRYGRIVWAPTDEKGGGDPAGSSGGTGASGDAAAAAAGSGSKAGTEGTGGGDQAAAAGAGGAGDAGKAAAGDGKAAAASPDFSLTAEIKSFLLSGLSPEAKTKAEEWLGRRSSISDLFKGAYNADSKIQELSQGRLKVPTGKDDDPADVAAWRKANGIPEAADKYDVWKPEGVDMSDADKEMWGEALKDFHEVGIGQKQLDVVSKAFHRTQAAAAKEVAARVAQAAEKAQEDLRVEYGRDYKPNVTLANRWLAENMTGLRDENGGNILDKRFADGTALGEHPGFVKAVVALAKAAADDGDLIMGETTEGVDVDKRVNELMALMSSDPKKYASAAVQQEVQRLTAAQMRRGNGRAA